MDEDQTESVPAESYESEPATRRPPRRGPFPPRPAAAHRFRKGGGGKPRRMGSRNNNGGSQLTGIPADLADEDPNFEATGEVVELTDLRNKSVDELIDLANAHCIENSGRMRRLDLVFQLAKSMMRSGQTMRGGGCLEIVQKNHGFLRYLENSYCAGLGDVYLGGQLLRRYGLQNGDMVSGLLREPREQDRYFGLARVETINDSKPDRRGRTRALFEDLVPMFPQERFTLERDLRSDENITGRMIDIIAPIGKGQRGLLVSAPKSGKTVMLQHIAHAIENNHPEVVLIVLLIDERPEEVTEMRRSVRGEVVSSTFDEPATRHVQVAEMIIEKARRLVEGGKDVVIMLDSITRLARAHNTVAPQSGRILTGGVDSQALQRPKRFFGAARNIDGGGSLTIIATALVDTGSRMDEVIYEEFKGTGNMEIHLDRRIAERRIYPSILLGKSGTRREELLLEPSVLQKTWLLRKVLGDMDDIKATSFMVDELHSTKNNGDFFTKMRRG